jgi:FixJ family two-component response regulator
VLQKTIAEKPALGVAKELDARVEKQTAATVPHVLDYEFELVEKVIDLHPGADGKAMPGFNDLELQRRLANAGGDLPIVFLTGHGDISSSVQAMKAGAVDFLVKPVREEDLLTAIREAIAQDRLARCARAEMALIERRLASLTPRERQVLKQVVAEKRNKQIAAELGTVEKTIKVHRARVMEKMQAGSLAELVQQAARVGITPPSPPEPPEA